MAGGPTAAETEIRAACQAADFTLATTATLRRYGPEILGFLIGSQGNEDAAEQAFSLFAERLWQGMPRFEWKSSVRTWAYVLARHAAIDVARRDGRHGRRRSDFSSEAILEVADAVRTHTITLLRTESRNAFAELRAELPEEDRVLLILRVDRELDWREIARVFGAEESGVQRESARLRKRFQLVKERLRNLGKERGLI